MLSVIKLLASLADAIPALKDILKDVCGMLQEWQARRRFNEKQAAADIAINDVMSRMRDKDLRQHPDTDGEG
jgi:hypothetical protein